MPLSPEQAAALGLPEPKILSDEEAAALGLPGAEAPAAPPGLVDRAGTAVRKFFDPGYGREFRPSDIPKQMAKGASFLVGGGVPRLMLGGALYGAGSSESDNPMQMGVDAALGAAGGGALGLAGKAAAKYLPRAAHYFANKFLTNKTGAIKAAEELSPEATQAAYEAGAIRPLRSIQHASDALEAARDEAGARIGGLLRQLEAEGVQGPDKVQMAKELVAVGQAIRDRSLDPRDFKPFLDTAEQMLTKPTVPGTNNVPLGIAEDLKRSAQGLASRAYKAPAWAPAEGTAAAHEGVASRLRSAVEQAVEAQSPQGAAEFQALKSQFGPVQEAYTRAAEGAARSAGRATLGLPEALMLAGEHGAPGAIAMKAGRKLLPQTLGYAAWRGGQLANAATPESRTAARTLLNEVLKRRVEGVLVPAFGNEGENP